MKEGFWGEELELSNHFDNLPEDFETKVAILKMLGHSLIFQKIATGVGQYYQVHIALCCENCGLDYCIHCNEEFNSGKDLVDLLCPVEKKY